MISIPEKLDIIEMQAYMENLIIYTMWCLIGCSIGDFELLHTSNLPNNRLVFAIMTLAIINGLITSIILETLILARQMQLKWRFKRP